MFPAPLADKEQHAKHAADSTKQVLACLAVTYAVESPPFKSFITFLNSRSGLVWSASRTSTSNISEYDKPCTVRVT